MFVSKASCFWVAWQQATRPYALLSTKDSVLRKFSTFRISEVFSYMKVNYGKKLNSYENKCELDIFYLIISFKRTYF